MERDRFKSFIAVLIAIVTVLGASTAGLAAKTSSDAGDGDFAGMEAAISAQNADLINEINAYEHYRAYTSYVRYFELGFLLYDPNADEATQAQLFKQQQEVWGVADGIKSTFFESRYINPDGNYDIERELQEAHADDEQNADLDYQPHFNAADRMRDRSSFLTADIIVFAISFWFLMLAQVIENRFKYVMAALGIMCGLAGILGILIGRFVI
jgi:hypothetical protein